MPIIINNDMISSVVTEAYYGKPKEFKEVERLLVPIIDSIYFEYGGTDPRGRNKSLVGRDINYCDEKDKIEKLFMKALGVGDVRITFYGNMLIMKDTPITIPSSLINIKRITGKPVTEKDIEVSIFIDKGLIYNYNITPSELVAIMLHEMGHNFDKSVFHILANILPSPKDIYDLLTDNNVSALVGYGIGLILRPFISSYIKTGIETILRLIEELKNNSKFNKIINVYSMTIHRTFLTLRNIIHDVTKFDKVRYLLSILDPASIFGYGGEKFADSFASSYGYAVEISSFNKKISDGNERFDVKKIPVVNIVYDVYKCFAGVVFAAADPHPDSAIRVYSQVKKLRRELNNPSTPKVMRKELEEQISELEKMCEDMTNIRANAEHGLLFTSICAKIHIDVFKGYGDYREIFELIWRHEY